MGGAGGLIIAVAAMLSFKVFISMLFLITVKAVTMDIPLFPAAQAIMLELAA